MKQLQFIAMIAFSCLTTVDTFGQANDWRIVDGPGKGAVLSGLGGRSVFDLYYGASGHVQDPDKCNCLHYHGVLFGIPESGKSPCGWGCVIPVPQAPASAAQAATELSDTIDFIYNEIDPALGTKLGDIFDMMEAAAAEGCYTVVNALGNALSEELQSYFSEFGYDAAFDPMIQDLTEYVNSRIAALAPAPILPMLGTDQVQILRRLGSGSRGRLLDAGARINLRIGEMLTLQMLMSSGVANPLYLWQYKWKGATEGQIPSLTALAVYANYISLVAYQNTSLRLTGLVRHPETGRFYRDTILVNWSNRAY